METKEIKVSIVVVKPDGTPVPMEFSEGMGNGVLGTFTSDAEVRDGHISPLSLAGIQDNGYMFRDQMVKVILEEVK